MREEKGEEEKIISFQHEYLSGYTITMIAFHIERRLSKLEQ